MKKLLILLTTSILIVFLYFWFEPVFVHNFGKKPLPSLPEQVVEIHELNFQKEADDILKQSFSSLKTPSISAAISINGSTIWSNAIGYSDIDNEILATPHTLFRIGSTSKAITSLGLGVLLDRKALQLKSKVAEFVPYSTDIHRDITVKQLASHTSGIRNYKTCWCFPIWENLSNNEFISIDKAVKIFEDDPLLFESGTAFSYSTYNYTLLSAMMEGASKDSFPNFMKEEIFRPLQISNTIAEGMDYSGLTISKFYDMEENDYKETYEVNNSYKWAGGGFLSTPSDLVRIGNALLSPSLFSKETAEILVTPVKIDNGEVNEQNYALGWRNDLSEKVFGEERPVRIIHHGGTAQGGTALLAIFPEYNMTIAILINRSSQSFGLFDHVYALAKSFILKLDSGEIKNDKTHL